MDKCHARHGAAGSEEIVWLKYHPTDRKHDDHEQHKEQLPKLEDAPLDGGCS
jgi:hypothetical protein